MNNNELHKNRIIRYILIIFGTIFLGLGIIGIFLPVLPTTPFLLLTAACYARGSNRFYNWLLNNKWFGEYIKNYQSGKGIPINVKVIVILLLWITILISILFIISIIWIRIILIFIAIGVSLHIVILRTKN